MGKAKKPGCLWLLLVMILGTLIFVIGAGLLDYLAVPTGLLALLVSVWLVNAVYGKPRLEGLVSGTIGIIVLLIILGSGFAFLISLMTPRLDVPEFVGEESVRKEYITEGQDSLLAYTSLRKWKDNYGRAYQGRLTVRDRDYQRLKSEVRDNFRSREKTTLWRNLYDYIERSNRPAMDLVLQTLDSIGWANNLDRMAFADMVVSCIQDIPYAFVFQQSCKPAHEYEFAIRSVLEECPECCMGNVPFGVQPPVGFIQNLKGDCDSRTVLIFSVLKHFGYDVAILNSDYYQHSILGLNLPARGAAKIFRGKRYVVWETTARYFEAGMLPQAYNDLTHWNVILTSN